MINGSSFPVKVVNYNTVAIKLLLLTAPRVLLLLIIAQLQRRHVCCYFMKEDLRHCKFYADHLLILHPIVVTGVQKNSKVNVVPVQDVLDWTI